MLSLFETALETKADVLITLLPGTLAKSSDIESLAGEIAAENSDVVVGTNQFLSRMDIEDSPIKAYSRKAVSKLSFSHTANLGTARELGLEVSKCQVSSGPKVSAVSPKSKPPQNSGKSVAVAVRTPTSMWSFLFRNIWFWRTIMLVSGMVISCLLLAYSVIFWYTFQQFGSTTSEFPWLWRQAYTNAGAVNIVFATGLAAAIGTLIATEVVFFKWVFPEFRIKLEVFRMKSKASRQSG